MRPVTRKRWTEAIKRNRQVSPVWKGPSVDGVTQSLLGRWLVCRERFRLLTVYGYKPDEGFSPRLEYGNMWHICEETYALERSKGNCIEQSIQAALTSLWTYCNSLAKTYPLNRNDIIHWHEVCKRQYPVYIDYWRHNPDMKNRSTVGEEVEFNVPYLLPSGKTVLLRGKIDSLPLIGSGLYIGERKTRSEIDSNKVESQLSFDIQSGFYATAVQTLLSYPPERLVWPWSELGKTQLKGIDYNVVRRPLSGGKGSIRRKKATKNHPEETREDYYQRVADYFINEPESYFARWTVELDLEDVRMFQERFLIPCLESLCDWWEWIAIEPDRPYRKGNCVHYRFPYGVYNPVLEGRTGDLDYYLATGSTVGLIKVDTLFPELS